MYTLDEESDEDVQTEIEKAIMDQLASGDVGILANILKQIADKGTASGTVVIDGVEFDYTIGVDEEAEEADDAGCLI